MSFPVSESIIILARQLNLLCGFYLHKLLKRIVLGIVFQFYLNLCLLNCDSYDPKKVFCFLGVPIVVQWLTNPTGNHTDSIPALAQWVDDQAFPVLWRRLQTRLGSRVAVALAKAGTYSSDSTPSLGTSICHGSGPRNDKTKKKKKKSFLFSAFSQLTHNLQSSMCLTYMTVALSLQGVYESPGEIIRIYLLMYMVWGGSKVFMYLERSVLLVTSPHSEYSQSVRALFLRGRVIA